jgi:pyruvate formate lyase activating enzyme
MILARRHGIANVLVTNGCFNSTAAEELFKYTDAANVDLKCFSAETYKNCLNGNVSRADLLKTVMDFIKLGSETGVHIEVTTRVVPELNDTSDELDKAADFIASLGDIPWHLTAYHPDYRWNAPPTDPRFLMKTADDARKKLPFVYTGNI